jgi:hypothetical protein
VEFRDHLENQDHRENKVSRDFKERRETKVQEDCLAWMVPGALLVLLEFLDLVVLRETVVHQVKITFGMSLR